MSRNFCVKMDLAMEDVQARFRAGDEAAVREVYRRYGGAVATVARSIVGNPELVAEVVQQTFMQAWRNASTFDADRELGPWLYAIARRSSIDMARRERRPTMGDHAPETEIAVSGMSFERTWEIHQIRQAVDDLPADEREVVRLSHLVGFTHPEIAEKLDIPLGTVKSRSGRAHKRLAAALRYLVDHEESANQTAASDVEERRTTS